VKENLKNKALKTENSSTTDQAHSLNNSPDVGAKTHSRRKRKKDLKTL